MQLPQVESERTRDKVWCREHSVPTLTLEKNVEGIGHTSVAVSGQSCSPGNRDRHCVQVPSRLVSGRAGVDAEHAGESVELVERGVESGRVVDEEDIDERAVGDVLCHDWLVCSASLVKEVSVIGLSCRQGHKVRGTVHITQIDQEIYGFVNSLCDIVKRRCDLNCVDFDIGWVSTVHGELLVGRVKGNCTR